MLKSGEKYLFYGKLTLGKFSAREMVTPLFVKSEKSVEIRPIYPQNKTITTKIVQSAVENALKNIDTIPDYLPDYDNMKRDIAFHKERNRFCYVQTPGFFECFNDVFGIENHLMYLLIYTDEIAELYHRHVDWVIRYADHCIDAGADMIHISDDWGSQNNLLFSPELWWKLIYPNMKRVVDHVHSRGVFVSLHSDGCVAKVTDGIAELGFDLVHPWQENAGMSYDLYLENYTDRFAILGGVCVQSAIGLLPRNELEAEIRRVFTTLQGKRWVCCTSHFVQDHCSIEDLEFAYDLIYRLARQI